MKLLLVSNSTLYGSGYLDHAETEIRDFLGADVKRILFVPYAIHDRDAYAASVQQRFAKMGYELFSIHTATKPPQIVKHADAIFIGFTGTPLLRRDKLNVSEKENGEHGRKSRRCVDDRGGDRAPQGPNSAEAQHPGHPRHK